MGTDWYETYKHFLTVHYDLKRSNMTNGCKKENFIENFVTGQPNVALHIVINLNWKLYCYYIYDCPIILLYKIA